MIELPFQKAGLVTVGTSDPSQQINLMNPTGTPLSVHFNLNAEVVTLQVKSSDERNEIVRDFEIPFGVTDWLAFLQLFNDKIRPSAKAQYPEFDGLTQLYNSVTIHGTTINLE